MLSTLTRRGAPRDRARAVIARLAPAAPRALGVVAALAALVLLVIIVPVGTGVLLGALLAFTIYGRYRALVRGSRSPGLVAAGITAATTAGVAGTLGLLVYLLVLQGVAVVDALPQSFAPGGVAAGLVQRVARPLSYFDVDAGNVADRLRGALSGVAGSLASWAARIVGVAADGALALFFMAITMFLVLRHGPELAQRAERLMPLNPHHTRHLIHEVRRLGRIVMIGNFGTALIQGVLAGVGFAIARVPQAGFLGAFTAVASLLPAFGTLLVWAPVGLVLVAVGRPAAGAFELAWGAVVVLGVCDYFVRPRLVGRGETMSTWTTFVSLFGGLKLFGFVGFLLGPLLAGLAIAVLGIYERARRFRLG